MVAQEMHEGSARGGAGASSAAEDAGFPVRSGTGLRVSLRRLRRRVREQFAYRRWMVRNERSGDAETCLVRGLLPPLFSILLPCGRRSSGDVPRAIAAVHRQGYGDWELCLVGHDHALAALDRSLPPDVRGDPRIRRFPVPATADPSSALNDALVAARGRFVIPLVPDGLLSTAALASFAAALDDRPDALLLYADEDRIDRWGRRWRPSFKSPFNRVLLMTHDCVGHPVACDRDHVLAIGGWRPWFAGAAHHDFLLRATARTDPRRIVHVPRVLQHRRRPTATEAATAAASRRAVVEHLAELGIAGTVEPALEAVSCHRVRLGLPNRPPLVSIIVCTRDNASMLDRCVTTLRERTTYPAYEIVVVDNGSRDATTLEVLASLARDADVTVIRDDAAFNFSRLNNAAVARARGAVVCLLNDDTEILTPGWLEEMVGFALLEDVGPVGARLWFPDETLQHGGVVLDPERVASHAFARYPHGDTGYADRAVVQQEVAAVTAACLVVRRSVFLGVEGFEERLAVAFNDVDLCLRLREKGFRTVWTPYAELIHHESVSRGRDDVPSNRDRYEQEKAYMLERWAAILARDPCYGPHFSSRWADYSIDRD